ncbi:sodium-dependent transporter bedraggled isoform X2 [Rhynchophorus ferrugineus]|uniref:sodium-dependent transporter bedraggled isoform X2 n=1 Tax=Rhynchophorus ferrugineus TaxID=354439 RepID=UPI003FCECBD5
MSSSSNNDVHIDLIDFHVGSPVLPSTTETNQSDLVQEPDNLIDTELPVFEQKLQHASSSANCHSRRPSVDVEDILIDINSEEYERDSLDGEEVENDFLNICEGDNGNSTTTLPVDNFEALLILKNLDDLLNATLEESENAVDTNRNPVDQDEDKAGSEDDSQQVIEDCLEDLDNYLKAIGDSDSESNESVTNEQSTTRETEDTSDITGSNDTFGDNEEFNEEFERTKLRQMEENYRKFVALGVVNGGYLDTEDRPLETERARPMSACAAVNQLGNRKHACRATTTALMRKDRPRLLNRRNSLTEANIAPLPILFRTSGTDAGTTPESENRLASRDVDQQRHAHASVECCTGTVIVEPVRDQSTSSSSSAAFDDAPVHKNDDDDTTNRGTWLRTSMRRLQQLNLPSADDGQPNSNEGGDGGGAVRPVSAPSRLPSSNTSTGRSSRSRSRSRNSVAQDPNGRARSSSASSRSRRPRSLSSSVTSLASSVESTPSCMPQMERNRAAANGSEPTTNNNTRRPCDRQRSNDMPEADSPLGKWPHSLSSMMACLGCTLGLFNISRFAILSIHFGANFIFQFLLLTVAFGLPIFTLQLCLGQQLGAGVVDMWRISPLFQGVGVSLLITQALTGLYSIIGVSWMFVFFRDSFITTVDKYRWAEPFLYYRKEIQLPLNGTYKLQETIPDYFNGIVLQRYHLPTGTAYGTIKFQLAFNLAVVWMIVFVSLSKGLRSYGKVIYVFTLLPVFGTFVLCAKILGLMPPEFVNVVFPETSWGEFFLNSRSWLAAAQEVFLTWGLMGAAIMQIASHNKHKHLLQRDSSLVAVITISVLILVAFLANTCVQILKFYGYSYYPSSFERMSSYQFLRSAKDPVPASVSNTPVRYMIHNSFIMGERVVRPGIDNTHESGFQVLRLATELLPATFAVIGADQVSPFWAVLTYFIFIMFGIAQQLAIWHCVITGIMAIKTKVLKAWETTITFFSCACGFILGLPMATELGIYVVYFMDYTMGSIWWLTIVILLQIIAVFMVRGRPYSGDTVVTALFNPQSYSCFFGWAPALLSFTWNVILPVALMVLCITTFKNGSFRDMFIWHHAPFSYYWPLWTRQIGSMLQLLPVLCVPLVAVVQSYRYLNNGPPDILDRIQLLYRPPIGEHMEDPPVISAAAGNTNTSNAASEDPPPKYTPPPSYTTATGARLAKFLRQSIRRSMRRIANVLGDAGVAGPSRTRPSVMQTDEPPPPDYNSVFVEMNASSNTTPVRITTLERLRNLQSSPNALTAAEVASILRSSFRSSSRSPSHAAREATFADNSVASLSAEHLVDAAAPIGETSLVLNMGDDENKTQIDTSTVI